MRYPLSYSLEGEGCCLFMLYLIARNSRGTRPAIYPSETLLNSWREHPLKNQEHADSSMDAWEDVEDFDDVALN
jgi:hypothetical protein